MKKLVALFCLASAVAASAESNVTTYTEGGNTFGVLSVSLGTVSEAIIAVPWLEPSTGSEDIAVTNVIKTANLTAGDWLYYYDTSAKSYKAWQLDANKNWVATQVVKDDVVVVAAGSNQTLSRGNAILLKAGTGNLPSTVYLYGQVAKNSSSASVTVAQGTDTAGAYTLIAPPTASETDLNGTSVAWANVNASDYIYLPSGEMLVYVSDSGTMKWGYRTGWDETTHKDTYDFTVSTIPAGQGAWYVSGKGATTAATVTWSNLPSTNN